MKGCPTETLPNPVASKGQGGEREGRNEPAPGVGSMESGGARMLLVSVATTSGGGAEAVMTVKAPAPTLGSVKSCSRQKSLRPAVDISPGEARTFSQAPNAAWAGEDVIVQKTAWAKETPTTIRKIKT